MQNETNISTFLSHCEKAPGNYLQIPRERQLVNGKSFASEGHNVSDGISNPNIFFSKMNSRGGLLLSSFLLKATTKVYL